ncbi:hypothetical protein, partial [Promineifilum sp.]|uniref:hypothetical protein n=1 Tax=Promineifilum sp. TaxID=2664178 RepID=UPI0035AEABF1
MNTRRKQFLRRSIAVNFPLWLLLAVLIVIGCTGPNPESIPTLPATQSSPGQPTGEAVGGTASAATGEPGPVAPPITLSARHAIIEYSPRPQPPTTPPSLDDIAEPPADSWQTISPDTTIPFNSYDSLRVMEAGEALLDLGGFMQLLLKRDAVAQFTDTDLAGEAYDRLLVQPVDTPPLQEWVLSLHLLRGGFSGELEPGEGPVALTTPNAVIIVSGTQFFAAYDPAAGRTWVANFDGTVHVGDVPLPPGGLDDHTLAVIPPLDGRALWDIPPGLTMEDFGRLVDETGSPLAAAALLSGPTLLPLGSTGLAVYDAPAPDATQLGVLPRAHIVALRRGATGPEGEPYWEIACPAGIAAPPRGCWVRGGLGLAAVYNAGGRTPGAVTLLEPAGDCAAGNLSRFPHAGSVTLRWRADAPAANEFIGLRLGPAGESLIFATADPAAHQTAPGEWAYTAPVAYFFRPGVATYQWQVYRAGSDGLPLVESATGCFQVEPPSAPATPIPDSDGDGWLDP